MQILLWLTPPVAVTVLAMAWVGWLGREGRGRVDHDEAVRRLGAALENESPATRVVLDCPATARRPRERSTGVALRRTSAPAVRAPAAAEPATAEPAAAEPVVPQPVVPQPAVADPSVERRRAS